MLNWDAEIQAADVRTRLNKLTRSKAISLALGCALHASDRIAGSASSGGSIYQNIADILERFWQEYPQSLQSGAATPLATDAANLVPDEDGPSLPPGESPLAWAVAYGLSAATRMSYDKDAQSEVLASIDQSYQAVFTFFHEQDHDYNKDEEIQQIEASSDECQSEIQFQLSLLSAVEQTDLEPPSLSSLMQLIRNSQRGHPA